MNLLSSFSAFLRANKERVVRSKEVLVSNDGLEDLEYIESAELGIPK